MYIKIKYVRMKVMGEWHSAHRRSKSFRYMDRYWTSPWRDSNRAPKEQDYVYIVETLR